MTQPDRLRDVAAMLDDELRRVEAGLSTPESLRRARDTYALAAPDPSLLAAVEASPPEAVWSQTDRMYGWTVAFQHLRAASSREAGPGVAEVMDVYQRSAPLRSASRQAGLDVELIWRSAETPDQLLMTSDDRLMLAAALDGWADSLTERGIRRDKAGSLIGCLREAAAVMRGDY